MVGEESLEMKAPGAICSGSKGRLKLSSKETKGVIQIQIEAIDVIREKMAREFGWKRVNVMCCAWRGANGNFMVCCEVCMVQ